MILWSEIFVSSVHLQTIMGQQSELVGELFYKKWGRPLVTVEPP